MKACMKGVAWDLVQMEWCGVVEWVKRNIVEVVWSYGDNKNEEFVKKVCVSETEVPRRRGRLVVRWKDRVREYIHDRVADRGRGIELARREF